jgi:hypothetical protein
VSEEDIAHDREDLVKHFPGWRRASGSGPPPREE